MRPNQIPIFLRPAPVASSIYVADTFARASMGSTTSGGQAIDFDNASTVIAIINSSTWLSNVGIGAASSYRVSQGAHSTMTWDFDINPGTGTNFPNISVGLRSDGTVQNFVELRFDGFGHLDLYSTVASVNTNIGSRSATSIDNTGATTYHVQAKVDAGNNWTVKINGVNDANLAGSGSAFAANPYFVVLMSSGALIANTGIKNLVITA